jgi:hypothetical protein
MPTRRTEFEAALTWTNTAIGFLLMIGDQADG